MSISNQTDRVGPVILTNLPQGIATQFPFQLPSDLLVLNLGTFATALDPAAVLVLNSDYTVSGGGYDTNNNMQSGTVTLTGSGSSAVVIGDEIVIMRSVPLTQLSSATTGPLTGVLVEQALDKAATIAQQLNEASGRALRFENFETLDGTLPLNLRKNNFLGFDAFGQPAYYPASPAGYFTFVVTPQQFGAKGDGITNDTTAIQAAINYVQGLGGGTVYFPPPPGKAYLCNVIVTRDCVTLRGTMGRSELATCTLQAFSPSSPTIQIGDGFIVVNDCSIIDLSVSGRTVGLAQAPEAVRWLSAYNSRMSGVTLYGGVIVLHFEGSSTQPVSCIDVSQFHIRQDYANAAARAIQVTRHSGSYTTGITFHGGHVSGGTGSLGYAFQLDGEYTLFSGVYFDLQPGQGFFLNGGTVYGMDVNLDPGTTGAVVVTINDTIKDPSRYLQGAFICPGQLMQMSDLSTITFQPTLNSFFREPRLLDPYIGDKMYFNGFNNPFDTTQFFNLNSTAGPIQWNGSPFSVLDATQATTPLLGSLKTAGGLSVAKNLMTGGDVNGYGGNAQQAFQLTAVAGTGGAYLAALGSATNQDIQFHPKGAGRVLCDGMIFANVIGSSLSVTSGTNALAGTVTLAAGAGTITSTAITVNSAIILTRKAASGTATQPLVTCGAGSATIAGGATDNGTYNWISLIVN